MKFLLKLSTCLISFLQWMHLVYETGRSQHENKRVSLEDKFAFFILDEWTLCASYWLFLQMFDTFCILYSSIIKWILIKIGHCIEHRLHLIVLQTKNHLFIRKFSFKFNFSKVQISVGCVFVPLFIFHRTVFTKRVLRTFFCDFLGLWSALWHILVVNNRSSFYLFGVGCHVFCMKFCF